MAIRWYCPHCRQTLSVASRKAGNWKYCPSCQGLVVVPDESQDGKPARPASGFALYAAMIGGALVLLVGGLGALWAAHHRAPRITGEQAPEPPAVAIAKREPLVAVGPVTRKKETPAPTKIRPAADPPPAPPAVPAAEAPAPAVPAPAPAPRAAKDDPPRAQPGIWKTVWTRTDNLPGGLQCLAIDLDGNQAAYASYDGTITICEASGGKVRATLQSSKAKGRGLYSDWMYVCPRGRVTQMSFFRDKPVMVAAGASGSIELWDTQTEKVRQTLNTQEMWPPMDAGAKWGYDNAKVEPYVSRIALSPDGKQMVVQPEIRDFVTPLWDVAANKVAGTLNFGSQTDFALDILGDPALKRIPRKKDNFLFELPNDSVKYQNDECGEPDVVYSPDGKFLAVAMVGWKSAGRPAEERYYRVALVDLARRKIIGPMAEVPPPGKDGYPEKFHAAAHRLMFSADGTKLVTVTDDQGADGRAVVDKYVPEDEMVRLRGPACRDGDRLIEVWDMATKQRQTAITVPHPGTKGRYYAVEVALHPDGHSLATLEGNGRLTIWDTRTGKPVTSFQAHAPGEHGCLPRVAFSPDGRSLFTAATPLLKVELGKYFRPEAAYVDSGASLKPVLASGEQPPNEPPIAALFNGFRPEVRVYGVRAPGSEGLRLWEENFRQKTAKRPIELKMWYLE